MTRIPSRRRTLALLVVTSVSLLALGACGSPQPPTGPAALTVEPDAGPPGTFISVRGLADDVLESSDLVVIVGGVQMPAVVEEDGSLTSMLPLFIGDDGWHEPAGPVDVVVERQADTTTVVGVAADAVTVTALAPAPDAHERIVTAAGAAVDAFETIALGLPTDTDEDTQIMWAVAETLRETLLTGENSLDALAAGTAPILDDFDEDLGLEIGSALLASIGIPEMLEELADQAGGLAAAMVPLAPTSTLTTQANVLCPYASDPDEDLACKMQLYVVVRRIGQELLGPIARQFGYVTSLTGIAGIAIKIPYVSAVGVSLSLANLTWNRIVVALLPAKIDAFTLAFDDGEIVRQGDRIEGRLELTASNDPPSITSNDLLGLMMTYMSRTGGALPVPKVPKLPSGQEEYLIQFAIKTINYFLGILAKSFAAYADAHPELNLKLELTAMPSKTWGPTRIEDYNLFDAHSFTPAILPVDEETPANPAWRAPEGVSGDARVNVRTATGDAARKIIWSGYQGGAFGDDQAATETVTVCVDDAPVLDAVASVAPTVIQAETNAQISFTLPWSDHCANLERLYATFDLDGYDPFSFQYDVVSSPQVAGFAGEAGEGALVETMWVWCSEQGKNQVNATFYLLDEFSQASEERTAFVLVDYGACP
ncbi:MAG: hypothetical protein R6W77_12450 [Trueperaceae bacterium]